MRASAAAKLAMFSGVIPEPTSVYLDNAIQPGESYYYVGVEQSDGRPG